MKRWNGWGDTRIDYPLHPKAADFLAAKIGPGTRPNDADFDSLVKALPDSRLPDHPLVKTDPDERLRHARGQSLPDWISLRGGRALVAPDGVVFPETDEDVRTLIDYARESGASLIPYGGGTSVVGHINPLKCERPVLTVDMRRMNRLENLDITSHIATFGAGVAGPDLEAHLRAQGFTLGHYPQSFEYSTLGGWIATRSSGQQSLHYGRIERLFAGGSIETPEGTLNLAPYPASAAGPDLREIVLGSEGRMGIITRAALRISTLPEREVFRGVFFPDFEAGMSAVRQILQTGLPLSMLRLSTGVETETTLALAGHAQAINALERLLRLRGIDAMKSLLLFGYTGPARLSRAVLGEVQRVCRSHGGVSIGGGIFGRQWQKSRFRTPYLRNTLWEKGYAVDTLETATTWDRTADTLKAIEEALYSTMARYDERLHVFSHLSHGYTQGSSIYTTYVFRLAPEPDLTLDRWQALKAAASEAILTHGGTISHQHGVGIDHAPYLEADKGESGLRAIRAMMKHFDSGGMMNPGKLIVTSP